MNIKKIRKDLGLTQAEFAEELGISRASLSDYERNRTKLPLYIEKSINSMFGDKKSQKLGKINKELNKENKILKEKVKFLEKKLKILESSK